MKRDDFDALEKLIDAYGLTDIITSLGEILREKAMHVRETWQDERTAKVLEVNASRLEKFSILK